jgi:hypothetical protein
MKDFLMSSMLNSSLSAVPNGQVIAFEKAELRRLPFQDGLYLWVQGLLPATGFDARLAPRIYHDGRPDYWGIEVAAFAQVSSVHNNNDQDHGRIFERSVPLNGITGIKGISVIGANRVQQIDIDGRSF